MSSPNGSGWFTTMLMVLAGGLAVYGLIRGPGSCPLATSTPASPAAPAENPETTSSAPAEAAALVHADESSFDQVLKQAKGPVLVDFYADWCGPCQMLAPVLDRVAQDLTDGQIVKVNVDQSPQLASRYGIESIPTLLVFHDGELVNRSMGFHSEDEVRRLLQ